MNRHYEAEYQKIKTDDIEVIDDSNIDIIDGKVFIEPETFKSLNKKELADSIPNSKLYDKNHNEITNDSTLIGTGYSLEYNGKEYPIIVYGDVNGDGKINMPDLTVIYRHISSIATGSGGILNDIQKLASNINKDEKVDLSDMMSIYYIIIK